MKLLRDFLLNTDGATSIEYGLIAVLVSVFLIAGATFMGNSMSNTFNKVSGNLAASTR